VSVNRFSEKEEQTENGDQVQIHPQENGKKVYTADLFQVVYQNDVDTDQENDGKKGEQNG
jgi:hypothetical protein